MPIGVTRTRECVTAAAFMLLGILIPDASGASSVSYTYDQLGRVRTALYDNGLCVKYSYDPAGNRTSANNTTGPQLPTWGTGTWGCIAWTP